MVMSRNFSLNNKSMSNKNPNQMIKDNTKNKTKMFLFHTNEFDKSPRISHKSWIVVTPAKRMTNRPTHFTLKMKEHI